MHRQLNTLLATAALIALGSITPATNAADEPAADARKLEVGLTPTVQLLQLMDTDQNGKVSKEEFMRFMESEFAFADKNKDGELDPKELRRLVQALSHPHKGPGR